MNKTHTFNGLYKYSLSLLIILALSLSSCSDQDDDQIYDGLIGQTWVGDLGFYVGNLPVESGITFSGNDYAVDEQYYYNENGGGRAATLTLRWWVEGQSLWLDYGSHYPMLEIRNIRVGNLYLHGSLFADGQFDSDIEMERMSNR